MANRPIFCLLFVLLAGRVSAMDHPPLTHLGIGQGLSNNSVRCIFQDHYGFMWFGTYDGLSRWDGYEFKVFRNKLNDSSSLPHNYIYDINEDDHYNLWVGTGQGIGIYNNLSFQFSPAWFYPYGSRSRMKIRSNVTSIKTDAKGDVLIGTNGWGLQVREAGSDVAIQIPFQRGAAVITGYNVEAIDIDGAQRIWLFIGDVGLCAYDPSAHRIRVVNNTLKGGVSCIRTEVLSDGTQRLWLGTSRGLYQYGIARDSMVKAYDEGPGGLSSARVASLCFDQQGDLWIGTEGGGIDILHRGSGKKGGMDYLLPGEGMNGLTSESVFAIYEDKESRKWIGTLKGGIDVMDGEKNKFQLVNRNPMDPNSLINNFVSTFFEDKEGDLWIGTDGGGMSIWNRRSNHFTNFQHQAGVTTSLSGNSITSILQDHMGEIWISTFGNGINRMNKATGVFEHFRCVNSSGDENKNVWRLYEDHDHILWASTFSEGRLYRWNRALNRFEVFSEDFTDLISITEDRNGDLWAGDSHALFRIDRAGRGSSRYEIGKPVRAIYEDHKGNFWIGTEGGGLILFDRNAGKIIARYSDADGLCNNAVLNILEDREGDLWLSTFNGLSRWDPASKTFKNFYQGDGLQSNQFIYSAALPLRSGELAFGGINGFNLFYPDSIRSRRFMPPLLLTGLRVDNSPEQLRDLRIPYDKAILSFDFAALEYSSPSNITYAYFLDGWDKGWNYTKNIRTVNYTHLSEGSYTLRLKSTNAEGVWNTQETTLDIVVLPPWFRSWWAYLIYTGLLGTVVFYYRRYKVRQTKLEYEIKIAHLNAEKEKEISEKRLSFFTSISHEFRTPLTLIINPLKDMLTRSQKERGEGGESGREGQDGEINIVYRNARRLLSLVDQLLLFRKAESEGDRLKITKLNFYDLCKEVYLAFVQKAKADEIEYLFECDNEGLELYADREKMEIVFYNLVSNALKYTPSGGKISFRIRETAERVDVTIEDTGLGISKETGQKLFEKFYQVMEDGRPAKTGFGIGLYLVKQFVESHKGKVSYESEPGKGTRFFVSFLKGKAHFGGRQVFEELAASPVFLEELAGNETPVVKSKAVPENKAPAEGWVSEQETVLIIDDNEQILEYIRQIFKDQYTIYQAGSGEEGLKLARQYQPDIIITDIVMQDITGIELCRTIKEDLALGHIPVILLTGSPSPETKLQGVEGGADDYITKPFEKEILLARVASLLKSRNSLQKYFYNEITLQKNTLKVSEEDKQFIERCIQIVESHLDDDEFSIKTLAAGIGMSHSGLYKKIKSVSGGSVNSFIRWIRLRRVAELLINTEKNVNEAALEAGFNDLKYFREQFHKLFGVMPSEYIRKFRPTFSKNLHVNRDMTKK